MERTRSFPSTRRQSLPVLLPALAAALFLGLSMWRAINGPELVPLAVVLSVIIWLGVILLPRLLELPHENVARGCLAVAAAGTSYAVAYGTLENVAAAAALMVPLIFLGEMFRPGDRQQLLRQVSGTYTGGIVVIMGSLWFLVARNEEAAVGLICAGAMAGALIVSLPLIGHIRVIGAFLGALGGSFLAAAQLVPPVSPWWICVVPAVSLGLILWGMDALVRSVGIKGGAVSKAAFGLIPVSAMGVVGYALSLLVL